jgi:hypothetical protein
LTGLTTLQCWRYIQYQRWMITVNHVLYNNTINY